MQDFGLTNLGTVTFDSVQADPQFPNMAFPVVLLANQGALKRGMLLQKIPANTFAGLVNAPGDDQATPAVPPGLADDATTIPVDNDSGTLVNGSTVRIGNEFITVGAYNASTHQFTSCVRGVYGSTAAAIPDNAVITVIDAGATVEKYKPWDGLQPIAGYLQDDTDTTGADAKSMLVFHDVVKKTKLTAKTGMPIKAGFVPSANLLIVEAK